MVHSSYPAVTMDFGECCRNLTETYASSIAVLLGTCISGAVRMLQLQKPELWKLTINNHTLAE